MARPAPPLGKGPRSGRLLGQHQGQGPWGQLRRRKVTCEQVRLSVPALGCGGGAGRAVCPGGSVVGGGGAAPGNEVRPVPAAISQILRQEAAVAAASRGRPSLRCAAPPAAPSGPRGTPPLLRTWRPRQVLPYASVDPSTSFPSRAPPSSPPGPRRHRCPLGVLLDTPTTLTAPLRVGGSGPPFCSSGPNSRWGKGLHAPFLPRPFPPPPAPPEPRPRLPRPHLPRPAGPARRCPGNRGSSLCRRRPAQRSNPRATAATPAATTAAAPQLRLRLPLQRPLGRPCRPAAPRHPARSCCPRRPCCSCCSRGPVAAAWPARCPPRPCPRRGRAPRSPAGTGACAPRGPRPTCSPRPPSASRATAAPAPPGSPAPTAR